MQKGIVVFIFANYLDDVLVWNYAMSGFKRGVEKAGMGSVPACICVLNSLKFRLLPKNCPREWRVGWRFLCAYAGLLVNATMIALFACQRLKQTAMAEQTLTTTNHGRKAWLSLTTVGSSTTNWVLLKFGCTPITNMISNTYCTVSVIPYWVLTHQANPNIHRTPL